MRDSYVGDIGDFANNGLLRHIFGGPGAPTVEDPLKLAVVSYLNDGRGREPSKDGRTTGYLVRTVDNLNRFRNCDWRLYDKLEHLVISHQRTVKAFGKAGMLPDGTTFYNRPLPRATMRRANNDWVNGDLEKVVGADVVFINPDNGISSNANHAGPKHVSIAELKCFYDDRGKSLIIYQHQNRTLTQIYRVSQRLKAWLCLPHPPRVLRWAPSQLRYYFIVPQPYHKSFFDRRIEALKESKWCKEGHFTVVR